MAVATYNIKETAASQKALQKAKELGLTLTSGYRSPEKNKAVGGSPTSNHLKGQAYDFAGSYKAMDDFAKWARGTGMYSEVIWQSKGHYDHVHIAWKTTSKDTVRRGDRGQLVKTIQDLLGITNDGVYGPQTEKAVKDFQASKGLGVDGIVGQNTWAKLTGDTDLQGGSFFY